jgi:hypothetical protein
MKTPSSNDPSQMTDAPSPAGAVPPIGCDTQRRIDDLRAALERAERDRNLLAVEVKAWRAWYEEEKDVNVTDPLLYQAVINAWRATDAAKAMEEGR